MKKLLLFTVAFLTYSTLTNAQWNVSGNNIYYNAGNVGIGTADPEWLLEVRKDQASDTRVSVRNMAVGFNVKARYELSTGTPLSYVISELHDFSGSPYYLFSLGSAVTGAYFESPEFNWRHQGGSTIMKLSNGTVKIGNITSTPGTYKLYVESGILTEKVKVAVNNSANWADYVFSSDYNLMPIQEVADFIKKNKHLPGIPSAEELVKDGGIDVNDMFTKQMAKIEELTLHLINLNGRIEQLEKENKSLKAAAPGSQK